MKRELKKLFALAAGIGILGASTQTFAWGEKKADKKADTVATKTADKKAGDDEKEKLYNLKLASTAQSFGKAIKTRQILAQHILKLNQQLKVAETDEAKEAIKKQLVKKRKQIGRASCRERV